MSVINILDQQTANLIAAGEVVDRPAAVAKELLENAIDAGGTKITIEIKNGGSSLIRVTDNGKGMSPDDVKNCVLRHATSKIKSPEDLEGIATLGFRGEALAAISAVSRFQVISKESSADFGVCMLMEGENTVSFEEVGCPDGTTITVRDIFFNVPARRKFLKKDTTETAYISQYVERIAISHPNIALKFIVDSRVRFSTPGNNELRDAVYSVYGREFVDSMTPVERDDGKIKISGFISIPDMTRINRNHQIIFVNNRLVRSRIISYAVEDAYKSYIMTDRYPAFVIFININPYLVDINVHPTKLEVRFVDDASVREAVYFAVKNVLENRLNPIKQDFVEKAQESFEAQKLKNAFVPMGETHTHEQQELFVPRNTSAFTKTVDIPKETKEEHSFFSFAEAKPVEASNPTELRFSNSEDSSEIRSKSLSHFGVVDIDGNAEKSEASVDAIPSIDANENEEETVSLAKFVKYRGIVFNTYVIAEYEDSMYIIDKHAAHERIIYESLKRSKGNTGIQTVIDTRVLHLSSVQFDCAVDNMEQLKNCGFDIEVFGDNTLAIRGVPTEFSELEISECEKILSGMIDDMLSGKSARLTKEEVFDKTLYTAACKAATKAGYIDSEESYVWLINKLFEFENVFCCPHGRPIIVKYTKNQIEKMFNRT